MRTRSLVPVAVLTLALSTPRPRPKPLPRARPRRRKAPAAAAKPAAPAAGKKSAFDKATLEAYVRHMGVWGPQITGPDPPTPIPSPVPGLLQVEGQGHRRPRLPEPDLLRLQGRWQNPRRQRPTTSTTTPSATTSRSSRPTSSPPSAPPAHPSSLSSSATSSAPYCKDEAKLLRQNLPSTYPKEVRAYFVKLPPRTDPPLGPAPPAPRRPLHLPPARPNPSGPITTGFTNTKPKLTPIISAPRFSIGPRLRTSTCSPSSNAWIIRPLNPKSITTSKWPRACKSIRRPPSSSTAAASSVA